MTEWFFILWEIHCQERRSTEGTNGILMLEHCQKDTTKCSLNKLKDKIIPHQQKWFVHHISSSKRNSSVSNTHFISVWTEKNTQNLGTVIFFFFCIIDISYSNLGNRYPRDYWFTYTFVSSFFNLSTGGLHLHLLLHCLSLKYILNHISFFSTFYLPCHSPATFI